MIEDKQNTDIGVEPGETIYDDDGQALGRVTGMTDDGFKVEPVDPDDPRGDDQEELPGQGAGEGYIMWRCGECGKMGELDDGIPSTCPNCGAPGEALAEAVED